jgi:hypothetical protein
MLKKKTVAFRAAKSFAETDVPPPLTPEAISRRAYTLFQAHGGEHGHDVEDWLRAEAELREGHNTDIVSPSAYKQRRIG